MALTGEKKADWQRKYMREYRQGKRRRPIGAKMVEPYTKGRQLGKKDEQVQG